MPIDFDKIDVAKTLNKSIGISYQQSDKTPLVGGVDRYGRTYYTSKEYADSSDSTSGANYVEGFKKTFIPFGIITDDKASTLDKISGVASDASFGVTLNEMYQNGAKPKEFIDAVIAHYKTQIGDQFTDKAAANATMGAYLLYSKWGTLSPAQKSIGLASVGVQGVDAFSGTNLSKTVIPGSQSLVDGKGITVGAGLQGLNFGVNAYALANNWSQLDPIGKIAYGTQTLAQGAQVARSFGMLGVGTTGATTSVTASSLSSMGATAAPEFGVGAINLTPGASVPYGYSLTPTPTGQSIAIPTANESTAAVGEASTLGTVAGVASIAAGTYTVAKNWGAGGVKGAAISGLGGSAISGGLAALGYTNPYLAAGIIAFSAISGAVKTGKSEDQTNRDAYRGIFKKTGAVDDQFKMQLADGSLADLGIDGHGDMHTFRYADKAVGKDGRGENALHAYDVDYTNDLDYFSANGGISLMRLLSGSDGKEVKQIGSQLGNAALGKVGYGKDMTQDNFNIVMNNLKGMYAKNGINSREEALALSNKMYGEKRINDIDLYQVQQSINMIFNNDFNTANKLSAGRFKGIDVAAESSTNPNSPLNTDSVIRERAPVTSAVAPSTSSPNPNPAPSVNPVPSKAPVSSGALGQVLRSKEEAIAANKTRYGASMGGAV